MIGLWTRTSHEQERATECAPEEAAPRPTLEYAPKPPHAHRSRIWLKRVTLTLFFISAIAFTFAAGKRFVSNWQLVRRQEARASRTAPQDKVALEMTAGAEAVEPLVFQHLRRRPDGIARLITVHVFGASGLELRLGADLEPMRQIWDWDAPKRIRDAGFALTKGVDRLYFGQHDPYDVSHFTIVYELNNQKGTIDGWLMNDDTVNLEVRDGPLRDR